MTVNCCNGSYEFLFFYILLLFGVCVCVCVRVFVFVCVHLASVFQTLAGFTLGFCNRCVIDVLLLFSDDIAFFPLWTVFAALRTVQLVPFFKHVADR